MQNDDVFLAIAHPVRRQILERLRDGAVNVTELAEPFAMTRSAISQHLKILRDSGLVSAEKQGREQVYRLEVENLNEIRAWIQQFERFWNNKLDALGTFLDDEAGHQT